MTARYATRDALRGTIRHPAAADSIRAYLRGAERVVTGSHIIAYMQMMHSIVPATSSRALHRLIARGEVIRPRRGLYRWCDQ